MSTNSSSKIGWFIIHFRDVDQSLGKDILFLNDPNQKISVAVGKLEQTVFERLGRLGDNDSGDGFQLLTVSIVGPDSTDLEITFVQLVTYIRALAQSSQVTKPDLFGFGSNIVNVEFQYHNYYEDNM